MRTNEDVWKIFPSAWHVDYLLCIQFCKMTRFVRKTWCYTASIIGWKTHDLLWNIWPCLVFARYETKVTVNHLMLLNFSTASPCFWKSTASQWFYFIEHCIFLVSFLKDKRHILIKVSQFRESKHHKVKRSIISKRYILLSWSIYCVSNMEIDAFCYHEIMIDYCLSFDFEQSFQKLVLVSANVADNVSCFPDPVSCHSNLISNSSLWHYWYALYGNNICIYLFDLCFFKYFLHDVGVQLVAPMIFS